MDYDDELLAMMADEADCEAECAVCGWVQIVEPDAEYRCPECKKGWLVSPLRAMGII